MQSHEENRMDARYAGISDISLSVTDLDRSKRWYAELLGWQESWPARTPGAASR